MAAYCGLNYNISNHPTAPPGAANRIHMNSKISSAVYTYPAADETPHEVSREPFWQESIFFFWWDLKSELGGIHRIGFEPGIKSGSVNCWNGVFSANGVRYRRSAIRAFAPEDRSALGFGCAPSGYRFEDGRWSFALSDSECELRLQVEDYVPLMHMYPVAELGSIHANYAKHHYESAGWVRGTARLGDRRASIDGLSYRDHSWGRREWRTLLSHRYFAGTVGPAFTCCTIHWQGLDGKVSHFGLIVRDGHAVYAERVDFLTYMEADGTTHRGGAIKFYMPGGEIIEVNPRLVDAMLNHHGGDDDAAIAAVDSICIFEYRGMTGFGDLEITNNPRNGSRRINDPVRAYDGEGLAIRDGSAP